MPVISPSGSEWFHGPASRTQVEKLVKKAGINGSFAIRTSESVAGAYTISLLNKGKVFTYRVLPTEGKYAIETGVGVQKKKFISIDGLVQEYKKQGNGLACGLTNPVGQEKPALPNRNPNVQRALPPIPPNGSAAPSAANMTLPPKRVTPYVRASYTGPSPDINSNPAPSAPSAANQTLPPKPAPLHVRASYTGQSPDINFNPAPISATNQILPSKRVVTPYVRASYTGPSPDINSNPAPAAPSAANQTLPPKPALLHVRASYTGQSPDINFHPAPISATNQTLPSKRVVTPYVRASYTGPSPDINSNPAPSAANQTLPPKPAPLHVRPSMSGQSPDINFNPAPSSPISAANHTLPPKPAPLHVRPSYTGQSPDINFNSAPAAPSAANQTLPPKPAPLHVRPSYTGQSPDINSNPAPSATNQTLPPKPVTPYVRAMRASYTGQRQDANFNPAGMLAAVTGRMSSTLPSRHSRTYESIPESVTPAMTASVPVSELQRDSPAPQNPAGIHAAVTGRMSLTLPPRNSSIYESVEESATPAMTSPVSVIRLQPGSPAPQNPAGMLATVTGRMSLTLPPRHSSIYESVEESATPAMTAPVPVIRLQPDSPAPQNPAPTNAVEPSTMEASNSCIICYDAKVSAFFQPCGHVCCCVDCSKKLKDCPLCRKRITKTHLAFVS